MTLTISQITTRSLTVAVDATGFAGNYRLGIYFGSTLVYPWAASDPPLTGSQTIVLYNALINILFTSGTTLTLRAWLDGTSSNVLATANFTKPTTNWPKITSPTIIGGIETVALTQSLQVTSAGSPSYSATPPANYTCSALPSGLAINATTGVISGTPAGGTAGSYTIAITATNSYGQDIRYIQLNIQPSTVLPRMVVVAPDHILVGRTFYFTVNSSDFSNFTNWTMTGDTEGITMQYDPASEQLMWFNGAAYASVGARVITVSAFDGSSRLVQVDITLNVVSPPVIQTSYYYQSGYVTSSGSVFSVPVNQAVNIQFEASNGPVIWSIDKVPRGFNFDATTGIFTGAAIAPTNFNITLTASNNWGTATAQFSFFFTAVQNALDLAPFLPWLHVDPTLIDAQLDLRTGKVRSYYMESDGIHAKVDDDLRVAVVIYDLDTVVDSINDLLLVICPDGDFERFYVKIQSVTAIDTDGGTYFLLETRLDKDNAGELINAFDRLNAAPDQQNAKTLSAMCELRVETADAVTRRSRLFNMLFEQNAA